MSVVTHTIDELGQSPMEAWLVDTVGVSRITWYYDNNHEWVVNFSYGTDGNGRPVTQTAAHNAAIAYDDTAHTITVTPA